MTDEDQKDIKPQEAWLGYPKFWMNAFKSMQKMQNSPFLMYMKAFEVAITPEKLGNFAGNDTNLEKNENLSFADVWQKSHRAAEDELSKGMIEAWQRYWMSFASELFNQYAKMYQAFAFPWLNLTKKS